MNKLKNFLIISIIVGLGTTLLSCVNNSSNDDDNKISILFPNWIEAVAFSNLAKVALEEKDYDVELTILETSLIYGELSKDDSKGDVFMDAWLPNGHKDYWADYGDKVVKIGESFSGGTTGLVVPSYVTINSIEELNDHKEKFDGEIIGIGSGAGIHKNTYLAIDEYDLDFEQITSSGPAMVASLEKAAKNGDWIVITGWKPHYKWVQHDLKYLEDPKGVYPTDVCAILSRRGFEKDMPKAAVFFNNFNLNDDQLNGLMKEINDLGEIEGATKWYKENKQLVDSWFNN